MVRVITYGVFDYLHLGHVRLFKNIKSSIGGDVSLTVAVHADACILQTKPDAKILYSESERVEMLSSIKYVDDIVIYDFIDTDLPTREFDILAVGPDQTNPHFMAAIEYCRATGKQVFVVPRTENICSSQIKSEITMDLK